MGGFTILKELQEKLTFADYIYFNDNAFHPYGTKSEEQLIERSEKVIRFLITTHLPDIIVVACNTASTLALNSLRKSFPDTAIVGVVPAVKPAAELSINKKIAVLATPRTIASAYLDRLIVEHSKGCLFIRIALPGLVEMVEASSLGQVQVDWQELSENLQPVNQQNCDTVVLGCTHYPLAVDSLKQLCPDVDFWVDSAAAVTRRVQSLLAEKFVEGQIVKSARYQNRLNVCYFSELKGSKNFATCLQSLGLHGVVAPNF